MAKTLQWRRKEVIMRICFYFLIFFLEFNLISSTNISSSSATKYRLIGLFPINSTSEEESLNFVSAVKTLTPKYFPQGNDSVEMKLYNNSNQDGAVLTTMLKTFFNPYKLTAIIGPGRENSINAESQFLKMIPEKVLHIVYNPVIKGSNYLHNIAPSVELAVDFLFDLMKKIKWNYVAIIKDETKFSQLTSNLFKEKAKTNRICIGLEITPNIEEIPKKLSEANIKGILVFGKETTVRSISRKVKNNNLQFVFITNEKLLAINNKELPIYSLQVMLSGFNDEGKNKDKLTYIYDSVRMALSWFSSCQTTSNCPDLKKEDVLNGSLEVYQIQESSKESILIGTYNQERRINFDIPNMENSFCNNDNDKSFCEKCLSLETVPIPYVLKPGSKQIVLILPIHNDMIDPFQCSSSIRITESVDFIEASLYAIKTSRNPDLGLTIVDSCMQPLLTIEKLLMINYTDVIGVIGGFYSLTTIPAAQVLTRLQKPQISYGAESHILSDRSRFPYFQRTVVSVEETTQAIVLLCKKMNWKSINIIYNEEPYGISGREGIIKYAKIYDICIVNDIEVKLGEEQFQAYLNKLRKTSKVKVVITFLLRQSQEKFLSILNEDLEKNEFIFIDSYGLGESHISTKLKNHFESQLIIDFNKPENDKFLQYYANLSKNDIDKNPWSKRFIEENKNCRFEGSFHSVSKTKCDYKYKESISVYHDLLIQSFYALINGTANSENKNAQEISEEIRRIKLDISGKKQRLFDDSGNINPKIKLFVAKRIKSIENGIPINETVATFKNGVWDGERLKELSVFVSVCNKEDSCTVCPEKTETLFTTFVVVDVILAIAIIVLSIAVFLWKKRREITKCSPTS